MKEVKLCIENNDCSDYEDTDLLLGQLKEEYDKPRPVILHLVDAKGQIITGRCNCIVGTLEGGEFLIVGNIQDILYEKK